MQINTVYQKSGENHFYLSTFSNKMMSRLNCTATELQKYEQPSHHMEINMDWISQDITRFSNRNAQNVFNLCNPLSHRHII